MEENTQNVLRGDIMFEMLIVMWVVVMPGLLMFAVLANEEKKRKARHAAHMKWVNSVNRANFEKFGVYI